MTVLTDVVIRQAPASSKLTKKGKPDRYEIKDTMRPGLRLAVQPSGAKSFVFRYTFGGKPRKITFGSYPTRVITGPGAHHSTRTKSEPEHC
jgi:hypothetical protein